MLRLNRPYLNVGIVLFESLTDARDSSARTDTRAEAVYGSVHRIDYFHTRHVSLYTGVGGVLKLLGNENSGVLLLHTEGGLDTLVNTLTDVTRIVDEDDLKTLDGIEE